MSQNKYGYVFDEIEFSYKGKEYYASGTAEIDSKWDTLSLNLESLITHDEEFKEISAIDDDGAVRFFEGIIEDICRQIDEDYTEADYWGY